MMKKSETKTRKPAARAEAEVLEYCLTMFSPEGELLQQINMDYYEYLMLKLHRCMWEPTDEPAIDEAAPEWLETPDFDYVLQIWFKDGDALSEIPVTRAQYVELKKELASMRAKPLRGKVAA
jgi:hypothetical protein